MRPSDNRKSALNMNRGIDPPPSVHPDAARKFIGKKQKKLSADEYLDGIIHHDRTLLGRAITLVESQLPQDRELAQEIIRLCLPHSGASKRIGITGIPGVGKSSFIEAMGLSLTDQGHRVAVLAIDPSSTKSQGSILGDKTRMEMLANDPDAFIRPSPTAGSLGGVARKTAETMILCEAAGFDLIFIETVGVGQSEIVVHSMVDCFLLLMLAGAGDELQGIKRGIMEMADIIAITKADGENIQAAETAKISCESALHLFPVPESGWATQVLTVSAFEGKGLSGLWNVIIQYFDTIRGNGYFEQHRLEQSRQQMHQTIQEQLLENFYNHPDLASVIRQAEKRVTEGQISGYTAAQEVLSRYSSLIKKGIT